MLYRTNEQNHLLACNTNNVGHSVYTALLLVNAEISTRSLSTNKPKPSPSILVCLFVLTYCHISCDKYHLEIQEYLA